MQANVELRSKVLPYCRADASMYARRFVIVNPDRDQTAAMSKTYPFR
jgi:hypothetical protein